jgi:hypothetical protein
VLGINLRDFIGDSQDHLSVSSFQGVMSRTIGLREQDANFRIGALAESFPELETPKS